MPKHLNGRQWTEDKTRQTDRQLDRQLDCSFIWNVALVPRIVSWLVINRSISLGRFPPSSAFNPLRPSLMHLRRSPPLRYLSVCLSLSVAVSLYFLSVSQLFVLTSINLSHSFLHAFINSYLNS